MNSRGYRLALLIAAAAAFLLHAHSSSAGEIRYQFTLITDRNNTIVPAMGADGVVAYVTCSIGCGVYVGDGHSTTLIADDSTGPFNQISRIVGINRKGTVAFTACLKSGACGLFEGNGKTTTLIVDGTNGPFSSIDFRFHIPIADDGTVAFTGCMKSGPCGVFTSRGAGFTVVAADTTGFRGAFSPVISSDGKAVTFFGSTSTSEIGIYLARKQGNHVETALIADSSGNGPFGFVGITPVISGDKTVVFFGCLKEDCGSFTPSVGAVFMSRDGKLKVVADVADIPGFEFESLLLAVNDKGTTIVNVNDPAGTAGVKVLAVPKPKTGRDPELISILERDTSLFGGTVSQVFAGQQSINEKGQVALLVRLSDGRELVVRADPVSEQKEDEDLEGEPR